jgi:hypothetical protein
MKAGRLFTEHPHSVGETYGEHFLVALGFGVRMSAAGIACIVHALFPFLFTRTGSRVIAELHEQMIARRQERRAPRHARDGVGLRPLR